jgi:hypothetical protein
MIKSVNEPQAGSHLRMYGPQSVNEPQALTDWLVEGGVEEPEVPGPAPKEAVLSYNRGVADPDELEDELEQAEEEGDFKSLHSKHGKMTRR